MNELTIVRENLMTEPNYTPYCGGGGGNRPSAVSYGCSNPRTRWDEKLQQFKCPSCSWVSEFPSDFIIRYKKKWNK